MENSVDVYVELLDEGTQTWYQTKAIPASNGLYKLLEPTNYAPEFDHWAFIPGSIVRLEYAKCEDGTEGLLAKHPDPNVVTVWVEASEAHAPKIRQTLAVPIGAEQYKLLPTPHYTPAQLWKFPPGSAVTVSQVSDGVGGTYFLARASATRMDV